MQKDRCVINICLRDLQHHSGNNLNVILGYCKLIKRITKDEKVKEYILDIKKAAQELDDYVQSIAAQHECKKYDNPK
jgi:two-component sensor histidine kinase